MSWLAIAELAVYKLRHRGVALRGIALLSVVKKALPLSFSAYIRSALLTLEHAIIPSRLSLFGNSSGEALASYGYLHGMALPIILYPMVLLSSFSSLLVPEFAIARSGGKRARMERIGSRAMSATLFFAVTVAGFMLVFSEELGFAVYDSYDAGIYIAVLAPVVPIMYLDHVADNMLKGIGEEVYSMWVNIADSLLSLALVFFLLPVFGIVGYALVIILMEGFNFLFSYIRLRRRVNIRVPLFASGLFPFCLVLVSSILAKLLILPCGRESGVLFFLLEGVLALCFFFGSLMLIRLLAPIRAKLFCRTRS